MAFQSKIFWGCIGAVFCWIFMWSGISNCIKQRQPFTNRHVNKFADNVEVVAILPLIPPILVYALILRFLYDPLRRSVRKRVERRLERKHELAERSLVAHERLRSAREDIDFVRREKMLLVLSESSEAKTASEIVTPQSSHFAELPAELRIQIYSLLDYGTALLLARANRFFYYERPQNSIDKEQRMTFLFYADSFPHNQGQRLACYGCLQAKSRGDFLVEQRTGQFDRFCEDELERRCFKCLEKNEEATVGRMKLWKFKFWRWRVRTFQRKIDRRASEV